MNGDGLGTIAKFFVHDPVVLGVLNIMWQNLNADYKKLSQTA